MHDGDIADRLRSTLRAEGDALPLTITPDELDRRLALRRRAHRNRRVGVIAAALAVVAVGSLLAATGGWFEPTGTGGSSEPSVSTPPQLTASPNGSPEGGERCTTIQPNPADQPPRIAMGAFPGESIAFSGALGAYRLGDRADGLEGDWASIDPTGLARVPAVPPTERLVVLASNPDACLTGLVADAAPLDTKDSPVLSLADVTVAPTRTIAFDKPPSGEWLVRVRVAFATQDAVEAWTETYFRIDTRDRTTAPPTSQDIGPFPPVDGIVLVQDASRSLTPSGPTGRTEEFVLDPVPPRAQYRIDVKCLGFAPLRWSIGTKGQLDFLTSADQPCDGTPSSREITLGTPTADLPVVIEADVASAWYFQVSTIAQAPSFVPPALRMWVPTDPDGAAGGTQAYGRCVSTAAGSDQCAGEWFILDGVRTVLLSSGGELTFGLQDGWRIDQARVTAVVTDQARVKLGPPEYSLGFVENGSPEVTIPIELGRGSWIVRVALNATRDGETFGANYDFPLAIE